MSKAHNLVICNSRADKKQLNETVWLKVSYRDLSRISSNVNINLYILVQHLLVESQRISFL